METFQDTFAQEAIKQLGLTDFDANYNSIIVHGIIIYEVMHRDAAQELEHGLIDYDGTPAKEFEYDGDTYVFVATATTNARDY